MRKESDYEAHLKLPSRDQRKEKAALGRAFKTGQDQFYTNEKGYTVRVNSQGDIFADGGEG